MNTVHPTVVCIARNNNVIAVVLKQDLEIAKFQGHDAVRLQRSREVGLQRCRDEEFGRKQALDRLGELMFVPYRTMTFVSAKQPPPNKVKQLVGQFLTGLSDSPYSAASMEDLLLGCQIEKCNFFVPHSSYLWTRDWQENFFLRISFPTAHLIVYGNYDRLPAME